MRPIRVAALSLTAALAFAACGSYAANPPTSVPADSPPAEAPVASSAAAGGTLTVYSGRSEELVGPLIEQFETETGIDVQVQYAGTTDLAATILEEADASPADVFFAQDAGALGAVGAEGRLAALPAETRGRVDERFVSAFAIANHTTPNSPPEGSPGMPGCQPPRNRFVVSTATVIMFTYSAIWRSANFIEEYSVWKPATSSVSASGRSKGVRLTSAAAATK